MSSFFTLFKLKLKSQTKTFSSIVSPLCFCYNSGVECLNMNSQSTRHQSLTSLSWACWLTWLDVPLFFFSPRFEFIVNQSQHWALEWKSRSAFPLRKKRNKKYMVVQDIQEKKGDFNWASIDKVQQCRSPSRLWEPVNVCVQEKAMY